MKGTQQTYLFPHKEKTLTKFYVFIKKNLNPFKHVFTTFHLTKTANKQTKPTNTEHGVQCHKEIQNATTFIYLYPLADGSWMELNFFYWNPSKHLLKCGHPGGYSDVWKYWRRKDKWLKGKIEPNPHFIFLYVCCPIYFLFCLGFGFHCLVFSFFVCLLYLTIHIRKGVFMCGSGCLTAVCLPIFSYVICITQMHMCTYIFVCHVDMCVCQSVCLSICKKCRRVVSYIFSFGTNLREFLLCLTSVQF